MAVLSITEAARAVGKSRSTLYRRMERGELSTTKRSDGSDGVDTSELFRVFGEPISEERDTPDAASDVATEHGATEGETEALRAQVEMLRQQLDEAREREERLMRMVEHSQRLLEPPKRVGIIERIGAAIREARRKD